MSRLDVFMSMKRTPLVLYALLLSTALAGQTSERVDPLAIARIREEALQRSHVMAIASEIADGIGGRLTGSPNLKRAQRYAVDTLKGWGIDARVVPWGPFGRGWEVRDFSAAMTTPEYAPLIAYPKAWSPGTNGVVRGTPILLDAQTVDDLQKFRGKLRGKIVWLTPPRTVTAGFAAQPARLGDDLLRRLAAPATAPEPPPITAPTQLSAAEQARFNFGYQRWKLLYDEGAAVVVEPGPGSDGTVYVTAATVPVPIELSPAARPHAWDASPPLVLPQVVMAAEHYNRIARLLARGAAVEVSLHVDVRFDASDLMSANVIGEIAGGDRKDEIVMIGGCLDSWPEATGGTDNAAGAAVLLEAMRILKTLNLPMRRTVRIGLWSAEEQGHLGSDAYVKQLGASAQHVSAYFNVDYGPGKIRGIYLQHNEAMRPIFNAWFAPLADLGASTLVPGDIGATDHVPFDEAGIPAFQFLRDFMEGSGGVGHTNMDTYDHLIADDLKQSAVVVAAFAYDAAMRDAMLPRKTR